MIAYLDAVARDSAEDKRRSFEALGLREGVKVLDAGCGTGDDVRALATLVGASGRVYGVDASSVMIAEARKRGTPANVEFVRAEAGTLPFASASFDAVRAERLFQHLSEPSQAAVELRRVIRDGGRAFVIDPDWETLIVGGVDAELTRRIARALSESVAYPWAGRNARSLLRRAGFRSAVATPVASSPSLGAAFDLFLSSALDAAIALQAVSGAEAARWLEEVCGAEQRGEFFCAVLSVATLATA